VTVVYCIGGLDSGRSKRAGITTPHHQYDCFS
jgi:hypothetical protein